MAYVHTCRKCGMTVTSPTITKPGCSGCPRGGHHSWTSTRVR